MPRLSLYRPEKGNDFKMIDRNVQEQFQVGGTDFMVYKYIGPADPQTGEATPGTPINTNPISELGIQDIVFGENRDRKYDTDVYRLRGIYTMLDTVFNLSQFGLFLNNDEILVYFHLRSSVESIGRKLMSGDVFEVPHLKDEYALNTAMIALRRYYVVTEVIRPNNGFSATWYPHLIRCKCQPLVDSTEFADILNRPSGDGNTTIGNIVSNYEKSIEINNSIIAQAEADALLSGYETRGYFVIPTRESGIVDIADTSNTLTTVDSDTAAMDASIVLNSPERNFYIGYLTPGDGYPPNGAPFTQGFTFPEPSVTGQFHLRTDYFPNRLYRWNGKHWTMFEDKVRMTMTNRPKNGLPESNVTSRQTQKFTFINNVNTSTIAGEVVQERQALSKALKLRSDN